MLEKNTKKGIVKREPSSQRRQYRLTAPARILLGGVHHSTRDWSLGGFAIENFEGAPGPGETVAVQFFLNFQGFEIAFHARAEIVHHGEREIGAKFVDLGEREVSLIKYFASAIVGGEVIGIDQVLKHIDRPLTPATGIAKPHTQEQKRSHNLRRKFIAAGYIGAGLSLAGLFALTIMSFLLRLDVQTAVINTGIEQVVSRDTGRIAEIYAQQGADVRASQPLFRVEDDQVAQWVATAKQSLGTARTQLHDVQGRRALAERKFRVYQSISSDQLSSAKAAVTAAAAERDEAQLEADRLKALVEGGFVAPKIYDQQKAVLAGKQGQLDHALAELKTVESSAQATGRGLMFSANYLVADLATLQSEETSAAEQVQVAEATLQQALQRQSELIYLAPYAGTIMHMYKSLGMTVDRGEEILMLRHDAGQRTIDAYLTQEEAASIQTGVEGTAYVPGIDKRYPVQVVEVDRTRGFLKEIETPKLLQPSYAWRGTEDKSAYAKLVFVSLGEREGQELAGGMPVFVNLPKRRYPEFLRLLSWFLEPWRETHGTSERGQVRPQGPSNTEGSGSVLHPISVVQAASRGQTFGIALWPQNSALMAHPAALSNIKDFDPVRTEVLHEADKALRDEPSPAAILHSSGVTDKTEPSFLATRKAFGDADKFALLAMAYRLSGEAKYLDGARRYVLAWAEVNQPTGEPIDETRLDGFLWGVDLLRPNLSANDTDKINAWLERWLAAKRAFKMGRVSESNNHQTHQLKIIVMLDKLLGRSEDYQRDLEEINKQLEANLHVDGTSIDYEQRDAMHYHIYDLEAWNEIALVTGCCEKRIDAAFAFFEKKIIQDPKHVEFAKSTAPIDRKRAEAGFDYAQAKPFDVHEAARAIFSYATIPGRRVDARLWQTAIEGTARKNLFYLARYYVWPAN